jgi:hypothetical protein
VTFNTTQCLEMTKENTKIFILFVNVKFLISRSRFYYKPIERNDDSVVALMKAIDKSFKMPFYGFRRMTAYLQSLDYTINRKRIRRLNKLMFTLILTHLIQIQTIISTHTCSEMLS